MQLNEAKYAALLSLTGESSGSLNGLELLFLTGAVASPQGTSIDELWMQWLAEQGFGDDNINQRWMAYLNSEGYTGELNEMLLQFWIDGGPSSGPTPAFHAFDDDGGSFNPGVITGVGGVTEASTSTRYYPDDSGVFQAYGSGVVGEVYADGKWWVVAQPATENAITYSRDLTNGVWSNNTVVTYDQTGLTGSANTASLVLDNSPTLRSSYTDIAIADDSATHSCRVYVAKDSDTSRFPSFDLRATGGTEARRTVSLNTATGEVSGVGVGDGSEGVVDAGLWWELNIQITNNGTGNTTLRLYMSPARSTTLGGATDNALTGSIIVGNAEVHLDKTIGEVAGSSPIFTSGSTASITQATQSFDIDNHDNDAGAYYFECLPQWSGAEYVNADGKAHQMLYLAHLFGHIVTVAPANTVLNNGADYRCRDAAGQQVTVDTDLTAGVPLYLGVSYSAADNQKGVRESLGVYAEGAYTAFSAVGPIQIAPEGRLVEYYRSLRRYDISSYAEGKTIIDGLMP